MVGQLTDLVRAHQLSADHRDLILQSRLCACFHCLRAFPPVTIEEWVDDGHTALCPYCHDETLLPDVGLTLNYHFLRTMREFWLE